MKYHSSKMKHIHKYNLIEVNVTYIEPCHTNTYQQKILREKRENTVIGVDIIYKTPHNTNQPKIVYMAEFSKSTTRPKSSKHKIGQHLEHKPLHMR